MTKFDRKWRQKYDEERNAIEARIHARARLDHALDGDYTLTSAEKDKLLDLIRGHSIAQDAIRYMELQAEYWLGIPDSGRHLEPPTSGTVDMK